MTRLASRTTRIATSATMKVGAAVDRLRRSGTAVIDFGAGEPDFGTPDFVNQAAHAAIDQHFSKYTPVGGTGELKRAIVDRYRLDYGVSYQESEVIACAGGKQALFNTALALFDAGDEVILHAPYWPTLVEQVKLAEATPVIVEATVASGFALTADLFIAAITRKTRGIIINTPCNPTGAVMTEDALERVAKECSRRGIWLVVDLCYEKLIFDAVPHNVPAVLDRHCRDLSVICGSASKAYAMTGWRCGWSLGPAAVIAAQSAIQSHATSNVSSITQKAVVAALTGPQDDVERMRRAYHERRDRLHAWLTADPLITCHKPAGAFYLFPDLREALRATGFVTTVDFAQALLDEARVALTPGEAFDTPGFARLSCAASIDDLREGGRRLVAFTRAHASKLETETVRT